ncbi:HdeD family acid-resistance protein [Paracoccus sp. Z118]|uniref:HdeD family acid-resistance protein n=1 Tax=Paracoccus sp. Z118 TaxID=2851017 RepID=UPI001C2C0212|nr:HdeD family acid-resistance protein [Paracoccus sp. Z118]MBV0892356.1 HdeD family acid-resistance protein [Paracoccus sp. Z118]
MATTRTYRVDDPHPELTRNRGWFIALGIILLILGVFAFANLLLATVASVYFIGIMMILGGIAQMVLAMRVRGWGRTLLLLIAGVLYILAGFFAFVNPVLASTLLTLVLAASLLVAGVLRFVVALQERPRKGWGWVLAGGIVSFIVALIIFAGWPVNSLWVLGLFLSADLIVQGVAWLFFGIALGSAR